MVHLYHGVVRSRVAPQEIPRQRDQEGPVHHEAAKAGRGEREITWPNDSNHLPVISWDDFKAEAKARSLVVIGGFIHDVSSFTEEHPGGAHLVKRAIGTDATTAFMGGVYDHSRAAQNLLAMMRVGVLYGGMEVEHLKARPFDSPISTASPSIASSSAASSSADLVNVARLSKEERKTELELDSYRNAISTADECSFKGYDRTTLHTPPSEMLVIARTQPRRRPGFESEPISRVDSMQSVPEARRIGELDSMTH